MLKKLHLKNFLSFKDTIIYFENYNVILGANASGKSNLIKSILTLKDSIINGVFFSEDSYTDFFENFFRKSSNPNDLMHLGCQIENPINFTNDQNEIEFTLNNHEYSIDFSMNDGIVKESYNAKKNQDLTPIQILNRNKREAKITNIEIKKQELIKLKLAEQFDFSSLINKTNSNLTIGLIASIHNIFFYKLEAGQIIQPSTWKNQKFLNPNGRNLSGVLEYYKQHNMEVIDSINEILKRNIPQFKQIITEKLGTKNGVYFLIEEIDGCKYALNELSDGTDYFVALITALVILQYWEVNGNTKGIVIIEEPEKCLHPQLLSEIIEITKILSSKFQIIITSHSSDLVSLLKPEDLILIDKDDEGSRVKRGQTTNEIELFLKEFSLDQAWLYNEFKGGVVYA